MREACECGGLAHQLVGTACTRVQLERDIATESIVVCAVYAAHATGTDLFLDPVRVDHLPACQPRRRLRRTHAEHVAPIVARRFGRRLILHERALGAWSSGVRSVCARSPLRSPWVWCPRRRARARSDPTASCARCACRAAPDRRARAAPAPPRTC